MAGARVSARTSAKSSPKSSPRSARSTPRPTRSTPLKASVKPSTPTRKPGAKVAKTSPYFAKTKKAKAEDDSDDEGGVDSATGMTESEPDSTDSDSEDAFDPPSDEEEEDIEAEEEEEEVDSDFLDEDDVPKKSQAAKRKSTGGGGTSTKKAKSSGTGGAKNGQQRVEGFEDEDDDIEDIELEEGQEIAGRIYPAPKTGLVPAGRISQNTLNFLKNLQIPERNDREWFRSHEPAFRQAEKEWKAFVGLVQLKFNEADSEIPLLPPNQVIHRIYRDVRFSSDKTPYKKSFSLSTSRGGRKGAFAGYHLSISPNDRSILACGIWQPEKNQLASIRQRFFTEPQRFRDEISKPEFVKLFGPAKADKGKRQNVFGHDDALKVAPKGVDKEHKDIDLLKLRSVAVVHHFTDDEIVSPDFQENVKRVVAVMAPFAHLLNDFISLPPTNDDDDDDEDA